MASCDLPSSSSASSLPTSNPEDDPSVPSATVTKKRKHYDKTFKLKVIMFAEKISNREAKRKFGVEESCIRDWRKNKSKIEQLSSKSLWLPGGGHKACFPSMEDTIAAWIDSQRSCNLRVTRSAIQHKALELYEGEAEFTASRGWLENFLKHNRYSLRRRTTVSQSLPNQLVQKFSSFALHVRKLKHKHQYIPNAIGNMDETPLWLDMPGDTTITRKGEHTVYQFEQLVMIRADLL